MVDSAPDTFSEQWLLPLLELGNTDPAPEIRLAALKAAAHFPLGRSGWQRLIAPGLELIRRLPGGSPIRRETLAFAASVPLVSVREQLCHMADDPDEPDRDAIAAALAEQGAPACIPALLARAAADDPEAFRLLAIAPLETTTLTPADIPPCRDGALWRALAVGRLGDFAPLEAVFAPDAAEPPLFWGSPWVAYERIATVRPIPAPLAAALTRMLQRLDDPQVAENTGAGLARALRLTAWAATGSADAQGEPLPPARPFAPVEAPEPFRTDANVSDLLTAQIAASQPAHDDGQVAWMIARTPSAELIRDVVALVRHDWPLAKRLRLLDILGRTADCQAGCAPTPFRGAGGSSPAPLRHQLIDDRTRASARPPPQPRAPTAASRGGPAAPVETLERSFSAPRAASPAALPDKEERRVRARIRQGGQNRNTFVAGAANIIRCWIGLPEKDGAASGDYPIAHVAIPEAGLALTAELCWGDQRDSKPLVLPAERTARSGDCDLRIDVPADERYVSAEIMFRYRGRCFEAVKLEAAALAPGEAEGPRDGLRIRVQLDRREVIAVDDAQPCSATLVFGNDHPPGRAGTAGSLPTLRIYDGQGGRDYALKTPGRAVAALNTVLFATEKSLVRRRAAIPGSEPALDVNDDEVRVLLRDMARFGAGLYNQLEQQGFADPGDRIQLLSLDPDVILPLEFVYDRGFPGEAASLCGGWQQALAGDAQVCPACGEAAAAGTGELHAQTICPFGFWSLRKVIERLDPAGAQAPRPARRALPPFDSVVFASSNKVPQDEREATWATIHERIPNATLAHHWDEWHQAVSNHPRLLIALPHHEEDVFDDFLEIGDETLGPDLARLRRGQMRADYVNPDGREPGPVLLLLGCATGAESELGYVQVVREFQKLKTAIVLGTLAQILGRHAAPLARELVAQLVAVSDPQADFGTVMRGVRRRMLARGYLLALCLVALGDAEWRLTPVAQSATTPP